MVNRLLAPASTPNFISACQLEAACLEHNNNISKSTTPPVGSLPISTFLNDTVW